MLPLLYMNKVISEIKFFLAMHTLTQKMYDLPFSLKIIKVITDKYKGPVVYISTLISTEIC